MIMSELERMRQVKDQSQLIGEFLEWLQSKYVICEVDKLRYVPVLKSIEELLAEFFEIDLEKVEQERQEILKKIREKSYEIDALDILYTYFKNTI